MLAAPVEVAEALVAEALLALEDVILAAVPLDELADEALALVADDALAVTELEPEEDTEPPETELGSLVPVAVREAFW